MSLELESGEKYAENMTIEELLALETTLTARGFNVVQKCYLLGVPFAVIGVRYAAIPPIPDKGPNKGVKQRGYVTLECAAFPERELKRAVAAQRALHYDADRRTSTVIQSAEELHVQPDERFVLNDGSTGIRRQITFLLHRYGLVRVFDEDGPIDERDPRFDLPWDEWVSIGSQVAEMGDITVPHVTRFREAPFVFSCPRGLRVSDYTVEGVGEAETYYLG